MPVDTVTDVQQVFRKGVILCRPQFRPCLGSELSRLPLPFIAFAWGTILERVSAWGTDPFCFEWLDLTGEGSDLASIHLLRTKSAPAGS